MRAFFPVVIGVLLTAAAAAAESANLIENPSFEAAGRDGLPADWTASSPDAAMRPIFQRAEGCAGRASMRRAFARRAITASATSTRTCRFRPGRPTRSWLATAARASIIPTVACWSTWYGVKRVSTTSSSPIGRKRAIGSRAGRSLPTAAARCCA